MCDKHKPIKLYDTGGTMIVCEKCGAVLRDWRPNTPETKQEERQAVQAVHS